MFIVDVAVLFNDLTQSALDFVSWHLGGIVSVGQIEKAGVGT